MSTSSNAIFTGTSRFSNDFQQVINRSVAIASLPISQLTNRKNALADQSGEVASLQTKFSSLQTALQNIGNSTGLSSLTAAVSDAGIARVSLGTGATPASYSLEVVSLGNATNASSAGTLARVSDPATQNISAASSFNLQINGVATTITPAANTLNSLVAALNITPGLNVQASLVNIGSTVAPDYRLSIQSTNLNADTLQLNDGTTDLLNTTTTGTAATYKVNGLPTPIASNSRTITLAPGVTAELLAPSTTGVASNITVTRQAFLIGSALNALVNSFNSAADELAKNRGKGGGALTGNSLILELGNKLRSLSAYSGTGTIPSLTSLGITFDGKGHLSYDSTVFNAAAASNLNAVSAFLGSTATGGFLKSAFDVLTSIGDATNGALTKAGSALQEQAIAQQARIDASQARVDQLRTNLQAQLARADAQVAALEQSYNVLSGLFLAQQTSNQNK